MIFKCLAFVTSICLGMAAHAQDFSLANAEDELRFLADDRPVETVELRIDGNINKVSFVTDANGLAIYQGDIVLVGEEALLVGTAFVAVFGGSIIVEQVMSIQGLGQWFFQAAFIRDFPVVQFLALYTATVVILINLIVDLSYGYIDPRVR